MCIKDFHQALRALPALCQGRVEYLREWLEQPTEARLAACAVAILMGGAAYGFTLGLWRAPLMGGYVALKLPMLITLTLLTNGLINSLFAQVLGSGLSFRQTLMSLLMSFATFALIAGGLSPIAMAVVLTAPGPAESEGATTYRSLLLGQVIIIVYAGITAHRRFLPILRAISTTPSAASLVFIAWLAGNLLVGAQLSWNLRPFFGQPDSPVQFLRADWNHSSFYESVWRNFSRLLTK
jgi:hypothetical protein